MEAGLDATLEQEPQLPDISVSRASTEPRRSSQDEDATRIRAQEARESRAARRGSLLPQLLTPSAFRSHWRLGGHDGTQPRAQTGTRGDTWGHGATWDRTRAAEPEWKIEWNLNCFQNGRVLMIDYISNDAFDHSPHSGKRHIQIAAQEFENVDQLKKFYSNKKRVHDAALRVIHVQNASWATLFLLKKFNIDHPNEIVGMRGFNKWARYERPRQRNGKPFPNGRSWREQLDPWRNVSRTAFGLDYLKPYRTEPPNQRGSSQVSARQHTGAKMMHLNAYDDSSSPRGYDVSVQRLSVYIQRSLGPAARISPELVAKNPYASHMPNGGHCSTEEESNVLLEYLDNTNTVIVFETSASMLLDDCLVQPRNDLEKRWRRLSFYLRKDDVVNDARLAAQCTNMILTDIFHGLSLVWDQFLGAASDHVALLEDKIYENPADESRAPELWVNQAYWLKVEKIMYVHSDLVREMQGNMRDLANVDEELDPPPPETDWLSSTPGEYERLTHMVSEDLVQPTNNLSDLMYKSVGIRDSRQSLQLGLSMWRLSWITFIFLPLTFIVGFFGMNVDIFHNDPSVGWYFVAAAVIMVFVVLLWYCVKHSLQRNRQTPYQRGLYESLYNRLEDDYPELWTSTGAVEDVAPADLTNRIKWRLLRYWFSRERTIDKKMYSSLAPDGDTAELGAWNNFKRVLLVRWLPQIMKSSARRPGDGVAMAEIGSAGSTEHYEKETISELARFSTPLAMADAEPMAVMPVSIYGLHPLNVSERRSSSRTSAEGGRPSSQGSSGIMIEERNLSDSESDTGEGASSAGVRRTSA